MIHLCWSASFLVCVAAIVFFMAMLLHGFGRKLPCSPLTALTAGTAVAVVLLCWPIHFAGWQSAVQCGLLTIFDSIRFFSMGADFQALSEIAADNFPNHTYWMNLYVAFLQLFAPVLTFTNVLSVFGDVMDNVQFAASGRRSLYILSALNLNSMTIAESIAEHGDRNRLIVFTNMSESIEENCRELCDKAKKLGAICLKKDITQLNLNRKKAQIEFFLVSDDQGLNLEHAVRLTEKHKESRDLIIKETAQKQAHAPDGKMIRVSQTITIYLYSNSPAAQSIVDSLDKGPYLLNHEFLEKAINDVDHKLPLAKLQNHESVLGSFSIVHIDPVRECVLNILRREGGADAYAQDGDVTIAVIGHGSFGRQFVKSSVWFYQLQGCKVKLNVFDKDPAAEKYLRQECPELMSRSGKYENGEAQYRIRCFSGVDCFTSDFDDILLSDPEFKKTRLVFVALGNDDTNILAATRIRVLFNQLQASRSAQGVVLPKIHAVIQDDQLVSNMASKNLRDHRGGSMDVIFEGTYSQQYSYAVCSELKELESKGFLKHIDWQNASEYTENYLKNTELYSNYSYYRRSSISRVLHEEMTDTLARTRPELKFDTEETEHMRWNAYMRSIGYRHHCETIHAAKLHCDLVPRSQLTEEDQRKDQRTKG